MLVQEGMHAGAPVLGQHPPGGVVEEAVDHHPVEAGQPPERRRGAVVERRQAGRLLETGARGGQPVHHPGGGHRFLRRRLDLDQHEGRGAVGAHILHRAAGRLQLAHIDTAQRVRHRADLRRQGCAEHRVERLVLPRHGAEIGRHVTGGVADAQRRLVGHQQQAVRLDRPRAVDRLLVAAQQVGGGWQDAHPGSTPRHTGGAGRTPRLPRRAVSQSDSVSYHVQPGWPPPGVQAGGGENRVGFRILISCAAKLPALPWVKACHSGSAAIRARRSSRSAMLS